MIPAPKLTSPKNGTLCSDCNSDGHATGSTNGHSDADDDAEKESDLASILSKDDDNAVPDFVQIERSCWDHAEQDAHDESSQPAQEDSFLLSDEDLMAAILQNPNQFP
jgi:hypothetical protein